MKFAVITANYKRPKIFALWCASMDRLRKDCGDFPVIVTSGAEDKKICENHGIYHITLPNIPVTKKFRTSLLTAKGLDVDYVMVVGSDDIISTETMKVFISKMEEGYDLITLHDIYFYANFAQYDNILVHYTTEKQMGLCRTVNKRVLDSVDWNMWPQYRNKGLDFLARKTIEPKVKTHCIIDNAKVFDVKSELNINRFSCWLNKCPQIDPNIFFDILSEEEKQLL